MGNVASRVALLAAVVLVVPTAGIDCIDNYFTYSSCIAVSGCGWCSQTGYCYQGTAYGPTYSSCTLSSWNTCAYYPPPNNNPSSSSSNSVKSDSDTIKVGIGIAVGCGCFAVLCSSCCTCCCFLRPGRNGPPLKLRDGALPLFTLACVWSLVISTIKVSLLLSTVFGADTFTFIGGGGRGPFKFQAYGGAEPMWFSDTRLVLSFAVWSYWDYITATIPFTIAVTLWPLSMGLPRTLFYWCSRSRLPPTAPATALAILWAGPVPQFDYEIPDSTIFWFTKMSWSTFTCSVKLVAYLSLAKDHTSGIVGGGTSFGSMIGFLVMSLLDACVWQWIQYVTTNRTAPLILWTYVLCDGWRTPWVIHPLKFPPPPPVVGPAPGAVMVPGPPVVSVHHVVHPAAGGGGGLGQPLLVLHHAAPPTVRHYYPAVPPPPPPLPPLL